MISKKEREWLRRRADKATKGPWNPDDFNTIYRDDAVFIAASRIAVPELLDTLEAALALIEECEQAAAGDSRSLGDKVTAFLDEHGRPRAEAERRAKEEEEP